MSGWRGMGAALVVALLGLLPLARGAEDAAAGNVEAAQATFDEALRAYRAGDATSAQALFEGLLDAELDAGTRGPVLYNLGNVHFRAGRFAHAVAAYTAAVESLPRSRAAWDNLELARAKAGLDPADRGDFKATVQRLVMAVRPGELALAGWVLVALLAGACLLEMWRGGAWLKTLIVGCVALVAVDLIWLHFASARLAAAPAMVVESATLYAEPNTEHTLGRRAALGERVEVLARQGERGARGAWVKVRGDEGTGWLRDNELFDWSVRTP